MDYDYPFSLRRLKPGCIEDGWTEGLEKGGGNVSRDIKADVAGKTGRGRANVRENGKNIGESRQLCETQRRVRGYVVCETCVMES